jgi:5-methylcytosine-specific restriction endonuclease McrA
VPSYIEGMDKTDRPPTQLSDRDLLAEVARLAACERQATADLIALLAEVDTRRLYLAEGCASLYAYCVERLHLSEHAAYHRIEAARAARSFPVVLPHLLDGRLTLTALTLLRPHLTAANCESLLRTAAGRSKRDVEILVRALAPLPDVRASVRKLPGPRVVAAAGAAGRITSDAAEEPPRQPWWALASSQFEDETAPLAPRLEPAAVGMSELGPSSAPIAGTPPPPQPAVIRPLSPARYSLHVTLSAETHTRLRRAQDLLRHVIPTGDPAAVLDRALTLLVKHLERTKVAAVNPRTLGRCAGPKHSPPSRRSRHIPAGVRRTVWARDEGRCAFVGMGGRCTETGFVELHHRVPFADGGEATTSNIELRCRSHNAHEARQWFGNDAEPFRAAKRQLEASQGAARSGPS